MSLRLAALAAVMVETASVDPWRDPKLETTARVADLLTRLTDDQIIAQLSNSAPGFLGVKVLQNTPRSPALGRSLLCFIVSSQPVSPTRFLRNPAHIPPRSTHPTTHHVPHARRPF